MQTSPKTQPMVPLKMGVTPTKQHRAHKASRGQVALCKTHPAATGLCRTSVAVVMQITQQRSLTIAHANGSPPCNIWFSNNLSYPLEMQVELKMRHPLFGTGGLLDGKPWRHASGASAPNGSSQVPRMRQSAGRSCAQRSHKSTFKHTLSHQVSGVRAWRSARVRGVRACSP